MSDTRRTIAALVLALVAVAAGCKAEPRNDMAGDVTLISTTQPAPRDPAERQVRVTVRDQETAGLSSSLIGRKCRVQLRRDALGMATNMPGPLTGRWGAEASVTGTVTEMSDGWLVVEPAPAKRIVIPHASILLIELQD